MPDIMLVVACLSQCLDPTTLRQLSRVTEAMLAMTGRVTMRGMPAPLVLSGAFEPGASVRASQSGLVQQT